MSDLPPPAEPFKDGLIETIWLGYMHEHGVQIDAERIEIDEVVWVDGFSVDKDGVFREWHRGPDGERVETTGPVPPALAGLAQLAGITLPDQLWWLSFTDPDLLPEGQEPVPGGPSFLGAVITAAPTLEDAITKSHQLGVNPGGAIKIIGPLELDDIDPEWQDRLLTADEILAIPEPARLRDD